MGEVCGRRSLWEGEAPAEPAPEKMSHSGAGSAGASPSPETFQCICVRIQFAEKQFCICSLKRQTAGSYFSHGLYESVRIMLTVIRVDSSDQWRFNSSSNPRSCRSGFWRWRSLREGEVCGRAKLPLSLRQRNCSTLAQAQQELRPPKKFTNIVLGRKGIQCGNLSNRTESLARKVSN